MSSKYADFYMGANSPNGFCTYYPELTIPVMGTRSYLIKGGAGTGKSTLMKRVAVECPLDNELVERIHCSSDPNSLDGVILTKKHISIVDATPPHVIEPQYPGGFQTVINLCEYFDNKVLAERLTPTVEYQKQNGECHNKCCRLLKCAKLLLDDNCTIVEQYTDFNKINALVSRIIKREFKPQNKKSVEHKRLLSAVTNQGIITFADTVSNLAQEIYLLKDDYGVSSTALLQSLRNAALKNGYEIYTCYCPLDQKNRIEHLIIPEISLAFITENRFVKFDLSNTNLRSVISYTRFTDTKKLKQKKQFLSFNRRAATELINAAVDALRIAKDIHDKLETQYSDAVDFSRVSLKAEQIIEEIRAKS